MDTKLHGISLYLIGLLIVVSILTGCSGIKPYPNTLTKNLHIRTETESASIFSKVRADVEIYRVDKSCQIKYEGTIRLNEPLVEVGIPSDRLSYLVFTFSSSSVLASTSGTISRDTLLKPLPGCNYDIKVSYKEDIYNVMIQETNSRKSKSREIELKELSACSAL
jgi:hypothetical protein